MCLIKSSGSGPDIFVLLKSNMDFVGRFSEKSAISNFTEIRPVGAVPIHTVRRTDGHETTMRQ